MADLPQRIKIQFCGLKEPILIRLSPDKTLLDMKKQLQSITSLHVKDQKLVVNGKILKAPDTSLVCSLKLNEDKLVILLTKSQLELQDYMRRVSKHQSEQSKVQQVNKASVFTAEQRNIVISNLFKGEAWTTRANLLLSQKGFLQFVIEKISRNNAFAELVKDQQKQIRKIILEQQTNQLKSEQYQLKDTYDIDLHRLLQQKGYPSEKVKEALHRCENSPAEAIRFLETNQDKQESVLQPIMQSTQDEQSFVYSWLNGAENRLLRIRLSLDDSYFAKYLNSVKYRSPALFGVSKLGNRFCIEMHGQL